METKNTLSHDGLDAIVATIIGWCEEHLPHAPAKATEVAFSDEWERQQIARELHRN